MRPLTIALSMVAARVARIVPDVVTGTRRRSWRRSSEAFGGDLQPRAARGRNHLPYGPVLPLHQDVLAGVGMSCGEGDLAQGVVAVGLTDGGVQRRGGGRTCPGDRVRGDLHDGIAEDGDGQVGEAVREPLTERSLEDPRALGGVESHIPQT